MALEPSGLLWKEIIMIIIHQLVVISIIVSMSRVVIVIVILRGMSKKLATRVTGVACGAGDCI